MFGNLRYLMFKNNNEFSEIYKIYKQNDKMNIYLQSDIDYFKKMRF